MHGIVLWTAAFIGCMRNVRIQTVEVNPVKMVHSPLGVGLSLGDCDLVDWCRPDGPGSETVCQNGGRCTSSWQQAVCLCTDDYSGQFCETCAYIYRIVLRFTLPLTNSLKNHRVNQVILAQLGELVYCCTSLKCTTECTDAHKI